MSDLIDRQAAIDAINALHEKPNAWLDSAVDAVMALPSARSEIIRCKDCVDAKVHGDKIKCKLFGEMEADDFCSYGEKKQ